MKQYSELFQRIDSENAFQIGPHITKVESQGDSVIRLNLGEPDFELPEYIAQEVKRQLDLGNTHYTDPQGVLSFREAIAHHLSQSREISICPDQVVVFPGAKPAIALSQQVYLNPGDEVIYPSPGFPIYESWIRVMNAVPVPMHLKEKHNFSLAADDIEPLITSRTKMIFLNFPSNPTGGIASVHQLEGISEVISRSCSEACRVFSDEIYEDIIFDGQKHASVVRGKGMQDRTIVVSGLSKSFSWTGGRIGFAAFPNLGEARVFRNLVINYFSCVPPFLQVAGALALTSPQKKGAVQRMVKAFQERRDYMVPALNELPGVHCLTPSGAFYVFPNIAGLCDNLGAIEAFEGLPASLQRQTSPATLFQMFALYRHRVAVMDRRSFGKIGSEGKHYLRLSIAASIGSLKEGVCRLGAAAEDQKGFHQFVQAGRNLFA